MLHGLQEFLDHEEKAIKANQKDAAILRAQSGANGAPPPTKRENADSGYEIIVFLLVSHIW